ncbi:MAG: 1,4-alpha-glucan branching protein domain-containing protein [bacterium]
MAEHIKLAFVLHTHQPLVIGYGFWPHGEEWLYEASSEVYIPLLDMLFRLLEDGIKANINISFSPVLCEQLSHPAFATNFVSFLWRKIESTKGDANYFQHIGSYKLADLAMWWIAHYQTVLAHFTDRYHYTIIPHFKRLSDEDTIEIMTSPATHPLLALLPNDSSIIAQLKQAKRTSEKHFSMQTSGLWLPECAYRPAGLYDVSFANPIERSGIETFITKVGYKWTVLPGHLIVGKPIGTFYSSFRDDDIIQKSKELYEPYYISDSDLIAFFRDNITAHQIWSGPFNYPRDPWYMDFHKKHFPSGNRYWRVTDPNSDMVYKDIYEPLRAIEIAKAHAGHILGVISSLGELVPDGGIITAPFDTEFFGHWWWEGLIFLEEIIRSASKGGTIQLTKLSDYISHNQISKRVNPTSGSWGDGGGFDIWLNDRTLWVWKIIHQTEEMMEALTESPERVKGGNLERVLNYALRELFFISASDWTYLIGRNQAGDYASLRVSNHYERFKRLFDISSSLLEGKRLDEASRAFLSGFNNIGIFDDSSWRDFR